MLHIYFCSSEYLGESTLNFFQLLSRHRFAILLIVEFYVHIFLTPHSPSVKLNKIFRFLVCAKIAIIVINSFVGRSTFCRSGRKQSFL